MHRKTWHILVITLVVSIFVMFVINDVSFAAGEESFGGINKNITTTQFKDSNFAKDITYVSDLLSLDVEEVGKLAKARHVVSVGLCTMASFVYSLQLFFTFFASIVMNWAYETPWIDSFAQALGKLMSSSFGKTFAFGNNSPILYVLFFAMIGVVISLFKMRVSEGFGKFIKILLLLAMSFFLVTNSAQVYMDMNKMAEDIGTGFTASKDKTSYTMIWDINAIRPWKILEFGGLSFAGNELDKTQSSETEASTQTTNGENQANIYSPHAADGTTISGGNQISDTADAKFDWSATGENYIRPRWDAIKSPKLATGILSKYQGQETKNNGGKIYKMLSLKSGARDDAATAVNEIDKGYFELSAGIQGKRLGMAFIMLIMSLPLSFITLAVAMVILILKISAMFMFFLWPIVALWAMASSNFSVVVKWITSVLMSFVAAIVVQFIFGILLRIVSVIQNDDPITFGYWTLGSMISLIMFAAAYRLYPKLIAILGGTAPNIPGMRGLGNFAGKLWAGKQLKDIKDALSKDSEAEKGENSSHDKFENPESEEEMESDDEEEVNNEAFGDIENDERETDVDESEAPEDEPSTEGIDAPEEDDGLDSDIDEDMSMESPEEELPVGEENVEPGEVTEGTEMGTPHQTVETTSSEQQVDTPPPAMTGQDVPQANPNIPANDGGAGLTASELAKIDQKAVEQGEKEALAEAGKPKAQSTSESTRSIVQTKGNSTTSTFGNDTTRADTTETMSMSNTKPIEKSAPSVDKDKLKEERFNQTKTKAKASAKERKERELSELEKAQKRRQEALAAQNQARQERAQIKQSNKDNKLAKKINRDADRIERRTAVTEGIRGVGSAIGQYGKQRIAPVGEVASKVYDGTAGKVKRGADAAKDYVVTTTGNKANDIAGRINAEAKRRQGLRESEKRWKQNVKKEQMRQGQLKWEERKKKLIAEGRYTERED